MASLTTFLIGSTHWGLWVLGTVGIWFVSDPNDHLFSGGHSRLWAFGTYTQNWRLFESTHQSSFITSALIHIFTFSFITSALSHIIM